MLKYCCSQWLSKLIVEDDWYDISSYVNYSGECTDIQTVNND